MHLLCKTVDCNFSVSWLITFIIKNSLKIESKFFMIREENPISIFRFLQFCFSRRWTGVGIKELEMAGFFEWRAYWWDTKYYWNCVLGERNYKLRLFKEPASYFSVVLAILGGEIASFEGITSDVMKNITQLRILKILYQVNDSWVQIAMTKEIQE